MNDAFRHPVRTREPQYDACLDVEPVTMGPMTSATWRNDPAHVVFSGARYKWVAKMLSGVRPVAEIGCGDAFFTDIVVQTTGRVDCFDFDPLWNGKAARPIETWDIVERPIRNKYGGIYLLDVFEHIHPHDEDRALENLRESLTEDGILIIGMPSLESQTYASPISKAGHVNCKSGDRLRSDLLKHFRRVFMFSMNDEVVHTGFMPMAHYLFGMCVGVK